MSMLRILGNNKKLCSGISRRDLIQAGGLAVAGITMGDVFGLQEAQAAVPKEAQPGGRSFGKAKRVIVLFLYGSPAQHDTFDMKPDAPDEIRGPFQPIPTSLPGYQITELLPRAAKWMHKCAIVNSMSHRWPIHGVSYALSGRGFTDLRLETNRRDPRHTPYFGSVVEYVDAMKRRQGSEPFDPMPRNVYLPHRMGRPGVEAYWLGKAWDPSHTYWLGKSVGKDPYGRGRENPYGGITPETRFLFGAKNTPPELTLDRTNRRFSLMQQLEDKRKALDFSEDAHAWSRAYQKAMALIGSKDVSQALDIQQVPMKDRERYGMTLFGQSVLAAVRLAKAGMRVTTVFWDEYNLGNSAWDTHVFLVNRLKNELCPGFDMAFSALMQDLEDSGMLDETLVCVMSEHGRTPKMDQGRDGFGPQGGGGRGHWSQTYTNIFAGAGIQPGIVIGKTDDRGAFVAERPTSPKDVLATIYHSLGIDPHMTILDRQAQPKPLVEKGEVMRDMLI